MLNIFIYNSNSFSQKLNVQNNIICNIAKYTDAF